MEELHDGRARQEVNDDQCGLLQDEGFTRYFTPEQGKGPSAVLAVIEAAP